MGFGFSVNGTHPVEDNPKVEAAVEAFLVELEKIDGVTANLSGFLHDDQGRRVGFQRSLPRDRAAELQVVKEGKIAAENDRKEAEEAAKKKAVEDKKIADAAEKEAAADEKAAAAEAKKNAPKKRTPAQRKADAKADAKQARADAKAEKAEAAEGGDDKMTAGASESEGQS